MTIECNVSIDLETPTQAEHVLKSVQLDDQGFVSSRVQGKFLVAEISAPTVASLLQTLDDYLACVTVAAGILIKKK